MNCQFCHLEMIKGQTFFGTNQTYWQDHTCHSCGTTFTFEKSSLQLVRYVIYVHKYRLYFDLINNTFKLGVFQNNTSHYTEAYEINSIPNITPSNALDKAKTILLFS